MPNLTATLDQLDELPTTQRLKVYETALRNLSYVEERGAELSAFDLATFLCAAAEPFIAESRAAAAEDAHERSLPPGPMPADLDHRPLAWGKAAWPGKDAPHPHPAP